jgi:DNA sulfur modification protein DndE
MRSIQNEAILFDMYYGGGSPDVEAQKNDNILKPETVTDRTPRFQKFSIKNVICDGARTAFVVKGLAEMPVRDLVLDSVSIQSEKGIVLFQAEGIAMHNFFVAPQLGPVLALVEGRSITVDNMIYPGGLDAFLKVTGGKSRNILLNGVDLTLAKKGIDLDSNVLPGAVIVK